jgi:WD40 repeat protein
VSARSTPTQDSSTTDSPYVGLRSYGLEDSNSFFGREAETEIIIGNLCAARLTVLYADSGAGKSSVLRAGVTAALLEEAECDRDIPESALRIPVMFDSWRDDPLKDMQKTIAKAATHFLPKDHTSERSEAPPTSGPEPPEPSLSDTLARVTAGFNGQLLIMLDQFEEYLLYRSIGQEYNFLADELARCISRRELPVNFLISIREDAYAALGDLFRGRLSNVYANTLHLEHLGPDGAREAIEKPLAHYNKLHPDKPDVEIEGTLVETMLDEVRTGQVQLENAAQGFVSSGRGPASSDESIETPYMQLVMTRLWECERAQGSRLLHLATLQELGGSQTIVRTHVTRALGELEPRELDTATEVFLHLVTPSGTKVAQSVADLSTWGDEPQELIETLVEKLAAGDQRIVRPLPPAAGSDSPRVEIFHDVLAKPIVDWCQRRTEQRLRRERNAARRRTALVSLLALVAIALAVFAYVLREHQIRQTHLALSRALASQSGGQLERDPSLASLQALAAYSLGETDEARAALDNALQWPLQSALSVGSPVQGLGYVDAGRTLVTVDRAGSLAVWNPSTGATVARTDLSGPATTLASSADGRLVATGTEDGRVAVWDVSRSQSAKIEEIVPAQWGCQANCSVVTAAVNQGSLLAFADQGGEAILWSLKGRSPVGRLLKTGGTVTSIAFDPKGAILAAGLEVGVGKGAHGEVRRWAVGRQIVPQPALEDEAAVKSVAVASGGMVAAGDAHGIVDVWAPHESKPTEVAGDGTPVDNVTFSPAGGELLATAYESGLLSIRSTSGLDQYVVKPWYIGGEALSLAFAPDGETLASGTVTGRVMMWNVHPPARSGPTLLDGTELKSVTFSATGGTIVTSDQSGRVRGWNAHTRESAIARRVPGGGEAVGGAISKDGRSLVAGEKDGKVTIWPIAGGAPRELNVERELNTVALGPNGIVAAGTAEGIVTRWEIATGKPVGKPLNAGSAVTSLAFSRDGGKLAAGTVRGDVKVWDPLTGAFLATLPNGSPVTSVAFDPALGSDTLASANHSEEVLIWNVRSSRRMGLPVTDHYAISSVAYSPDGHVLAAGDQAGEVLLSNAQTGALIGRIQGDDQSVESLAFNPKGTLLAAAGGSGEVSLDSPAWGRGSLAKLTAEVCARVHANLTPAEWARYIPGESYRRLCPGPG